MNTRTITTVEELCALRHGCRIKDADSEEFFKVHSYWKIKADGFSYYSDEIRLPATVLCAEEPAP